MKTPYLIIAFSAFFLVTSAVAQPAAGPPRPQDIVDVIYEFDVAPDGTPHNFKVARCERPTDRSDASRALTAAEKAQGTAIIAHHKYPISPNQVGKKRYDFLLFDTRSRHFTWGLRPRKT